jgi:hypothetical protein
LLIQIQHLPTRQLGYSYISLAMNSLGRGESSRRSSTADGSMSEPLQRAVQIVKSTEDGYPPGEQWIKIRLEPGDYQKLRRRLEAEDVWGYFEDKIQLNFPFASISATVLT